MIIILLNFPAAYLCAVSAINVMIQYVLVIENRSNSEITNMVIAAPGVDERFDTVESNTKKVLELSFEGDGSLIFKAEQDRTELDGQIESYVTGNMGGSATLIFENNGQYEIIYNDI